LNSKKYLEKVADVLKGQMNNNFIVMNIKLIFAVVILSLTLISCYDQLVNNPVVNQHPTTKLFLEPDTSISKQASKVKIHWTGDDPDGIVTGFYFSFDGVNWTFTNRNDSTFELKIGASDTTFNFRVSAVDNNGNDQYDSQVFQNNINYGAEPFLDKNLNGTYDAGETFIDIGLIDPNPATLELPVKNSAPVIEWNALSSVPDISYPAMSFGWNVTDIDGEETVVNIRIALNDTNNAVTINGGIRTITIKTKEFSSSNPLMDILIDGNPGNLAPVKLPGLLFDANNRFYVQAEDISGAKTEWIALPDTSRNWFVKKPKGNLLIVDDYKIIDDAAAFYNDMIDSIGFTNKYDILDLQTTILPYLNTTFLETIKLYDGIIWYTDNAPSLNVANATVQNYLDAGGKIFLSMQFPQTIDISLIEGFLPIETDTSYFKSTISINTTIGSLDPANYPDLLANRSFARVRAFNLKSIGVTPLYNFPNGELNGYIGFENSSKNLFYIGAPLQKLTGIPGSIKSLFIKVLFNDFNLSI
jgi:hypothetical protein